MQKFHFIYILRSFYVALEMQRLYISCRCRIKSFSTKNGPFPFSYIYWCQSNFSCIFLINSNIREYKVHLDGASFSFKCDYEFGFVNSWCISLDLQVLLQWMFIFFFQVLLPCFLFYQFYIERTIYKSLIWLYILGRF